MIRGAIAWLLLALETLISWPVFVVSWLGSAIWLSAVAGYRFARLDSEGDKRSALRQMLGEKAKR